MTAAPLSAAGYSREEQLIVAYLSLHRGRAAAIPMAQLAAMADLSTRALQQVVAHLIAEHAIPIGSATGDVHGYYLVEDAADVEAACAQLRHRIIHLARRMATLKRISLADVFGQLGLPWEKELPHGRP